MKWATMRKGYVYILKCSDGSYYTGVTNNPKRRLKEHQDGEASKYTKGRRPVKLVWISEAGEIGYAIEAEKQIKGWSRAKKEALINDDFDLLHELAKCKNETHYKNKGSQIKEKDVR